MEEYPIAYIPPSYRAIRTPKMPSKGNRWSGRNIPVYDQIFITFVICLFPFCDVISTTIRTIIGAFAGVSTHAVLNPFAVEFIFDTAPDLKLKHTPLCLH